MDSQAATTATTMLWWQVLCGVSLFNLCGWAMSAVALRRRRRRGEVDAEVYAQMRLQLLLSAGYVIGCGFRSAFPVYDIKMTRMFRLLPIAALTVAGFAQAVPLTAGGYGESFDAMGTSGTTLPAGWAAYSISGSHSTWTNLTGIPAAAIGGGTSRTIISVMLDTAIANSTRNARPYNFAHAATPNGCGQRADAGLLGHVGRADGADAGRPVGMEPDDQVSLGR